jgi:hypothetical protein
MKNRIALIAAIFTAISLFYLQPANAQFPGLFGGGPQIVYDPWLYGVLDGPILSADVGSATSLTTPGGAGRFQPQAQFLDSLMSRLQGVNTAGAFADLYPGWVDFGPDGAGAAANITQQTMTTYANAITVAQSQAADFTAEDTQFTALEACNASSIGVLQAIQCGNEINLAAAQQTQLLRQIEITRLIVDSVHYGEELNDAAQNGAHSQAYLLNAAQH